MSDTSNTGQSYDLEQDYRQFCNSEVNEGVNPGLLPSLDEFKTLRSTLSDSEKMLGFVAPGMANLVAMAGATISTNPSIQRMLDQGVDAISKQGAKIATETAQKLASGDPITKVKTFFSDGGGSGKSGAGGDGSASNPFEANRMNFNPKPVEVRLDSGLRSKGYGDYYPESTIGLNVLEITQVMITIPASTASKLKTFFDTVIAFNFQNEAQMAVSFNINAISNFTDVKLRNYMNAYASAYSKYVFYTSIIAYCDEPLQTNEGVRKLRSFITPTMLDDLAQLSNMLEGTPAPPKFREWIHFIYGAQFKVSGNPGSAMRMISPSALQPSTIGGRGVLVGFNANDVKTAITQLFGVRETTALIARVQPQWIPSSGGLAGGSAVPQHSPNWNTLWENLPYAFEFSSSSIKVYGPKVTGENMDVVAYGSDADILDGAITASWNGWDDSIVTANPMDQFRPGTMIPILSSGTGTLQESNRVSFHRVSASIGNQFMTACDTSNASEYSRMESTVVTISQAEHPVIWPGRERINNINIASTRQSNYEWYARLFEMRTPAVRTSSSERPSNRGGRSRNKGRKMGKRSSKPSETETTDKES